jgi:hypothetical protein
MRLAYFLEQSRLTLPQTIPLSEKKVHELTLMTEGV